MFLEHVNLTVSDIDRSVAFYTELLGLQVRWRRETTPELPAAAHVGDDRCYIAMFQASTITERPRAGYDAVGLNHFGFVVDDLDAAKEKLIELGCAPHSEADYEPGRRVYFYDPDGIEVELVQYETASAPA